MSSIDDVYKFADDLGQIDNAFELDGQWHHVLVNSKKKSNLSGAYCLSELSLSSGIAVVVGMLFNHVSRREKRLTLDGIEGVTHAELA